MRFIKWYIVTGFALLFYNSIIPQNVLSEKSIPAFSKLNEDLSKNIMCEEEVISQKFYRIFDRTKLNFNYVAQNQTQLECATPVVLEYERNSKNYSLSKRNELTSYIEFNQAQSILLQNYISPSGNFELTYETTGTNAVPLFDNNSSGTPDYIEWIAEYCDYSWHLLVDSLSFIPPLTGKKKYQIEFRKMLASGYTIEDPNEKGYTKIVLNSNFIEFAKRYGNAKDSMGVAKVTVAHELKHAVQFMYSQWRSKSWFLELDATWIEDIAYDDVNSYYDFLTTSQITNPGASLSCGIGYGNCIWMHFLTQNFGLQINRDIWEIASKRNTPFSDTTHYNIFNEALLKYGSSLEASAVKYFVWNYFTGANYRPGIATYKDARLYPTPKLFTLVNGIPGSCLLYDRQILSADFIKIDGKAINYQIEIKLRFDNSINKAALILKNKTGDYEIKYLEQADKSIEYSSNFQPKQIEEIILIPVSISSTTGNYNYTFHINNANVDLTKPVITIAEYENKVGLDNFPYKITADIEDESGVDTAYIEYKFDNGNIRRSELARTESNSFSGCICLDSSGTAGIRELQFRIIAIDSSASGNIGVFPEEGYYNIKIDGGTNITSVEKDNDLIHGFMLYQNYPNPFNPSTVISYSLPSSGLVTLKIYDVLGREVAILVNENKQAGKHNVEFRIRDAEYSSGIYFYTIRAGSYSATKKFVLIK